MLYLSIAHVLSTGSPVHPAPSILDQPVSNSLADAFGSVDTPVGAASYCPTERGLFGDVPTVPFRQAVANPDTTPTIYLITPAFHHYELQKDNNSVCRALLSG